MKNLRLELAECEILNFEHHLRESEKCLLRLTLLPELKNSCDAAISALGRNQDIVSNLKLTLSELRHNSEVTNVD